MELLVHLLSPTLLAHVLSPTLLAHLFLFSHLTSLCLCSLNLFSRSLALYHCLSLSISRASSTP